jgi:hypothetical protein
MSGLGLCSVRDAATGSSQFGCGHSPAASSPESGYAQDARESQEFAKVTQGRERPVSLLLARLHGRDDLLREKAQLFELLRGHRSCLLIQNTERADRMA